MCTLKRPDSIRMIMFFFYILLADDTGDVKTYFLEDFINLNMSGKVITSVSVPAMTSSDVIRTYKIMPRAEVNLALLHCQIYEFHVKLILVT